jgi:uncharacterized Rossmann fold enzyme
MLGLESEINLVMYPRPSQTRQVDFDKKKKKKLQSASHTL